MAPRLGLALVTALLLLAGTAHAQQYQRLHVRSFTLSCDTARPQLEQPFHVSVTIRVAENAGGLDNVYLPTFFGAEELGDEKQIGHGSGGSTYRETLTLVAHSRGILEISPAYMDAIDARDGKPKRFISNSLRIPVGGGPVSAVWAVLRTILVVVIDLVIAAAALFVIVAIFWRKRTRPAALPEPALPAALEEAKSTGEGDLAAALRMLEERRDRSAVLAVRSALWRLAGAAPGETLSDVLRRPPAAREEFRRLLTIVERAAFVEEQRLQQAVGEILDQASGERAWTFV